MRIGGRRAAIEGLVRHGAAGLLAVLLAVQIGCAPREGLGLRDEAPPSLQAELWRVGEATLYLAAEGPVQPNAQFVIPDLGARRVEIHLEAVSRRALAVALGCDGPARIGHLDTADRRLQPGVPRTVILPPRGQGGVVLDWRPETGMCRVSWGQGHTVILRPESEALPRLSQMSRAALNCRADPNQPLDPLQRVFLDQGAMLQTCPVDPGRVRLLDDPLDGLNARIEALTGSAVSRDALTAGDPDLPLDFSNAPQLDLIQLSYLHVRADFVGYLTARMLAHHAQRGTQVRILVTSLLMLEEDRVFYDSLSARYPNIQIQYYRWRNRGIDRPIDVVNQLHRVQHTRAFLTLSREPGRSRYIFGGRNLHDGFFFTNPFDLEDWPYLHTYDEGGFQDLGFFSVYEDIEVELRDDQAVRNIAVHHLALWNRDLETQQVGPFNTGYTDQPHGMRHYLSLPWADGRDQVRWFADAIDAAAQEVLIVTPYLNPPPAIQAALERAQARGVRVRLVARLDSTDPAGFIITALNRRYAARYAGLFEIEEYFPRPRMMHTKMMVIDGRMAVTTSTNLDHRAFWHDTENGLVFMETPQVDALLAIVEDYRQTARRLTPEEPEHPLGDLLYNWAWLRSVF